MPLSRDRYDEINSNKCCLKYLEVTEQNGQNFFSRDGWVKDEVPFPIATI